MWDESMPTLYKYDTMTAVKIYYRINSPTIKLMSEKLLSQRS